MSMKIIKVLFLVMGMVCGVQFVHSQNMNIVKTDGTMQNMKIADIRKITFSGQDVVLGMQSGASQNIGMSNIQKFTFENTTAVDELRDGSELQIYPNPVRNKLYLKSTVPVQGTVAVLNVSGILVAEVLVENNSIDVSKLSSGIYFIRVNNSLQKFIRL